MEPYIRKYRQEDKENLRYICRETAGEVFRKRESLLNAVPCLYNDYFTENEPDNIFVIDDGNGKAVGYIICVSDVKGFRKKLSREYIPKAIKADRGMFPACMAYKFSMILEGKKNGVHLHIDILPDYQRTGFGTKLIDTLRNHLYGKGIKTLSVNTIARDSSAYKFYIKYGFRENLHYVGNIVSLTIPTEKTEGAE